MTDEEKELKGLKKSLILGEMLKEQAGESAFKDIETKEEKRIKEIEKQLKQGDKK